MFTPVVLSRPRVASGWNLRVISLVVVLLVKPRECQSDISPSGPWRIMVLYYFMFNSLSFLHSSRKTGALADISVAQAYVVGLMVGAI